MIVSAARSGLGSADGRDKHGAIGSRYDEAKYCHK